MMITDPDQIEQFAFKSVAMNPKMFTRNLKYLAKGGQPTYKVVEFICKGVLKHGWTSERSANYANTAIDLYLRMGYVGVDSWPTPLYYGLTEKGDKWVNTFK